MRDVLYVALMVVFFVTATGFVRVCEWLIGPDEGALAAAEDAGSDATGREAVAA